jgi:hypothetical protein
VWVFGDDPKDNSSRTNVVQPVQFRPARNLEPIMKADEWPTLEEIEAVLRQPSTWRGIEKAQGQETVQGAADGEVLAGESGCTQDEP